MAASDDLVTVDRLVAHTSTAHAIAGQTAQLFVREVAPADIANAPGGTGGIPGRVVLMVHGGFWPSTMAYDLQYRDYSWMAYLARAGFDVFCMDMSGYGFSSRPAMDDPANLSPEDQQALFGTVREPSYPYKWATADTETADLDAVVDFIRTLRGVDRIGLLGWSGGGFRTSAYTDAHPDKVEKLVVFASSNYRRGGPDTPPVLPEPGPPMLFQTHAKGVGERWMGTVKCEGQVEPGIAELMWRQTLLTDPVGASWGPGGLRAPSRTLWGWNENRAGRLTLPVLVMVGEHDGQAPSNAMIFDDLGAERKAHLLIRCASHFAAWEMQRHVLHRASAEWLADATLCGAAGGAFEAARDGTIRAA